MQSTAMRMCPFPVEAQPTLCQIASHSLLTPASTARAGKNKRAQLESTPNCALLRKLSDGFDVDDLPPFIKTARRANAMRHIRRRALRARRELRQRHHTIV